MSEGNFGPGEQEQPVTPPSSVRATKLLSRTTAVGLLRFERSHIDGEAVLHIRLEQSVVGFVDLVDGNDFDIGCNVMGSAMIEHLWVSGIPQMGKPERLRLANRKPKA